MRRSGARALVFVVSAAVLVLEILAMRMLAPHVGVTVETYTASIGVVLAGIAAGSWIGGLAADRVDPRRLLGPTIVVGAALAGASVPIVRSLGEAFEADIRFKSLVLALAAFFLPALVLSAVNPTVVKLQLRDLHRTGEVVGSFVGIGTFGALVGTFAAGFFLVAEVATATLIYGTSAVLALLGGFLWLRLARGRGVVGAPLVVLAAVGLTAAGHGKPCDRESAYSCVRVEPASTDGRRLELWLDDGRQGTVDITDPTRIESEYMKAFAAVIETAWAPTRPIDVVHVGGGAFVMPRYLDATRPGSTNLVLELDPAVVEVAEEDLGLERRVGIDTRTGDARTTLRGVRRGSTDLVIGDAFRGLTVPWHLTTREFTADVDRVLRQDGIYLVNVIDTGTGEFLRSEIATLREQFGSVVAIVRSEGRGGPGSGNIVLVAAHRSLDDDALERSARSRGFSVLSEPALAAFSAGATVLTDDFAPVDQLLTRR